MFQRSMTYTEDEDSEVWIQRIDKREEELHHGRFEWARIYAESLKSPHIQHIADFRGPIEVKALAGRGGGRGIVAPADIRVGQLLVVEKPFASVYPFDLPTGEKTVSFNLLTNRVGKSCETVLISKVMERIWENPEEHAAVYNLFAGSEYPRPSLTRASPTTFSATQFPFQSAVDIDIMHLESIISYNAFCPRGRTGTESDKEEFDSPSALYLLASLFNHSCVPNAQWTCFGDVMIIRATKTIAQGEEIYIPYTPGVMPFNKRQEALNKHFPSGCPCPLCVDDRADGMDNCKQREILLERMKETKSIQGRRRLLSQIETTYAPSRKTLRPEMSSANDRLANAIRAELNAYTFELPEATFRSHVKELLALDIAALKSIGIMFKDQLPVGDQLPCLVSVDYFIMKCLSAASSCLVLHDRDRANDWVEAAESGETWICSCILDDRTTFLFAALKNGLGGDKVLFKLLFGKSVDAMSMREFVYSVLG
ncbi:hypothetical protein VKT23_003505 [Stygiomarasmius scandens]|uniref:SET domain-containing protein n=1 Tax=Marasmiellus scandens TaxID=2682957 RepID=A0ABR1K358_9AGAR